jgi:hypothetical protein
MPEKEGGCEKRHGSHCQQKPPAPSSFLRGRSYGSLGSSLVTVRLPKQIADCPGKFRDVVLEGRGHRIEPMATADEQFDVLGGQHIFDPKRMIVFPWWTPCSTSRRTCPDLFELPEKITTMIRASSIASTIAEPQWVPGCTSRGAIQHRKSRGRRCCSSRGISP